MASLQTIEIIIEAIDNASSPIGNIGSSLSNLGNIVTGIKSGFDLLGGAFDAIVSTIGAVKDAIVAVTEPIIDFGMESIMTAARLDELRIINEVLANNAGISIAQVRGEAEAVRAMGIEAGIAEEVMAAFIRSNLDLGKASDLARVAQDAAVISGSNSSETLDKLIYGIETLNPLILRNAGITLDTAEVYKAYAEATGQKVTQLSAEEKQLALLNAVLEEGTSIMGAYEAAMENPFKMIGSFPRYIDDIMVAVGGPFQEAFGKAVFAIADMLKWFRTLVEEGGELRPTLDNIAVFLGDMVDRVVAFIPSIQSFIFDIAMIFDAIAEAGFGSIEMWETVGNLFEDFFLMFEDGSSRFAAFLEIFGLSEEKAQEWAITADDLYRKIRNVFDMVSDAGWGSTEMWEALSAIWGGDQLTDFVGKVKDIIDSIKSGDIQGIFETLFGNVDWAAIYDNIDTFVANMIQRIDQAVSAWIQSGGPDQLGAKFLNWVNALADPNNPDLQSKTMAAALNLMRTLIDAFASLPWAEFYTGFTQLVGKALLEIDWEGIFVWLMEAVGKVFVGAIAAALDVAGYALKTVIDAFVDKIRGFFGISSPSTVFAEIGRELVMGLLIGWQTAFTILLSVVTFDLARLAALFTGAASILFDGGSSVGVQGDASSLTGSTGTVGGRPTGGSTLTGGMQTVNNYYYGPVYFGAAGEPGAYYDCPSPSPFITATASGGTLGGRSMAR